MTKRINDDAFSSYAGVFGVKRLMESIRPVVKEEICSWCERSIDLSFDHTSSASGLVKLYPYQREILAATDDPTVQEVTIQAGQRLGKSQLWKFSLLKRIHDGGCSGLIVYPSVDLGERTNRDTVLPLIATLPEASADLSHRGNKKIDSYHMPSLSSVVYFCGGGSQVISATANMVIMDECDFVELQNSGDDQKYMSQAKALRLRMQSFKRRMMIVCSSPTSYGGVVHQNWKRGSMGEWHVRCLECGGLSPSKQLSFYVDGKTWAGLQWQKTDDGQIIEESIRWICPQCGHEHRYADAWEMNERGTFVHARPGNTLHRSYQIGALANPSLWTWREIAQAVDDSGGDPDAKKYLANTIQGIPYKHVKDGDVNVSIEETNRQKMVEYPADLADRISVVVAGIDQQGMTDLTGSSQKYWCMSVRGWCENGDSYLLWAGTINSMAEMRQRVDAKYHGHRITLCMVDHGGGFNADDTDPFVRDTRNTIYWKGAPPKETQGKDYVPSKTTKKLFLCHAIGYQVKLLDRMYSPHRAGGYGWHYPHDVDEEYFRQICNVQPNTRMGKDGNGYEFANWAAFGMSRRDFFDCEKMSLCALDIACDMLPPGAFVRGHIPAFYAKEKLMRLARQAKICRKA